MALPGGPQGCRTLGYDRGGDKAPQKRSKMGAWLPSFPEPTGRAAHRNVDGNNFRRLQRIHSQETRVSHRVEEGNTPERLQLAADEAALSADSGDLRTSIEYAGGVQGLFRGYFMTVVSSSWGLPQGGEPRISSAKKCPPTYY